MNCNYYCIKLNGICKQRKCSGVIFYSWYVCSAAISINGRLNYAGYTSSATSNPTISTVFTVLSGTHKVVYSSSHGSANGTIVCSNGDLSISLITSSNVKLVYFSACQSAAPANSSSSSRGRMASLGVPITIGFKQNVSAAGDYSGINLFDDHFFQYAAVMGTTIATAVSYALTDVYNYEEGHNMRGTDSIEYTGGSSYMP